MTPGDGGMRKAPLRITLGGSSSDDAALRREGMRDHNSTRRQRPGTYQGIGV
jgi:hypothetical protein